VAKATSGIGMCKDREDFVRLKTKQPKNYNTRVGCHDGADYEEEGNEIQRSDPKVEDVEELSAHPHDVVGCMIGFFMALTVVYILRKRWP
jgi:hypothetical protein